MNAEGGPAFSTLTCNPGDQFKASGLTSIGEMSLRQWYKGQAIAGLASTGFAQDHRNVAKIAGSIADCLIEEDQENINKRN